MTHRHVRRQIIPLLSTSTSRTSTSTTPPPATPTSTSSTARVPSLTSVASGVTSIIGPALSTSGATPTPSTPGPPSSTTSSSVPSVPPTATPPLSTTGSDVPVTVTQTDPASAPPPNGSSESKGKSFLENKPLSGFVFGLAGLVGLIIVFIVVAFFVRRRNRKRLLADASTFSFDPRDVEDGTSDEKHSHSGLVGQLNSGRGQNDYPDSRVAVGFVGVGTGSTSRPGPLRSPPMPAYAPRDYVGYDGSYPAQYHNPGNVPVGYGPTHNSYDMYDPRNGGTYSNNQGQHDLYNFPGSNGDIPVMNDLSPTLPRQLQPGFRPAHAPTFHPRLSDNAPPPLNYTPPVTSTISPPPPSLQSPIPDYKDLPRLPTPGALPNNFGPQNCVEDADDDAYGGAFLGPESPPGQRTLQVANM